MKPTAERYQAATKVNALSPEIDDFEKADSVQELEGSTAHSVKASCEPLFRGHRQGHGIEWIASEPGRAFGLLAQEGTGSSLVRLSENSGGTQKPGRPPTPCWKSFVGGRSIFCIPPFSTFGPFLYSRTGC